MSQRKSPAQVTPDMFEDVLQALKCGTTVKQFVRLHKDRPEIPTADTIYDYCLADSERKRRYTLAREQCAHAVADDVIDIADNERDPQTARNRMNSRQWLAGKILPKVYGDKLDVDVSGRIDVTSAIVLARQRAGQLIDVTPQSTLITSDTQSDVIEHIDPFS